MRTLASLALLGSAALLPAAEPNVSGLTAFPPALAVRGADDAPQLLVTGNAEGGRPVDLTGSATYAVSNPMPGGTVVVQASELGAGFVDWFAPECLDCLLAP